MDKVAETAYQDRQKAALERVLDREGRPVLRYRAGTLVEGSRKELYQVQADGSWRKVRHANG